MTLRRRPIRRWSSPRPRPMSRRGLLGALPLGAAGIAGLVACEPGARERATPSPTAPPSPVDPTPTLLGEQAAVVEPGTLRLPLEMTVMIVVDPGWTAAPQQLDGIFLGHTRDGDALRFTAADQAGTLLWSARRPPGCEAAVLTRDASTRTVAVLPDLTADGGTTLTGYRLRGAERLWGPLAVPGPPVGPGLLVAAADGTGRAALDAGTGETLLAEAGLQGDRLLAEHHGTVLCTDGDELVALAGASLRDSVTGPDVAAVAERWRITLPAGIDAASAEITGPIDPITSHAVLRGADGTGALLDLRDGRILAEGVTAAAHDHALDVTVVVSGRTVRGLAADGTDAWQHEDPESVVLISAGERLAYAQRPEEGTLLVLDTSQGQLVNPYDVDLEGPLAVPELFSADAATSVYVEDTRYLVTTALDEDYGLRDETS